MLSKQRIKHKVLVDKKYLMLRRKYLLQGCFQPGRVPDEEIVCEECGLARYCSWGCRAGDEMHQYECGAWQEAGQAPDRHGNSLTAANDEASHRYLFVIFREGDVAVMHTNVQIGEP